MTIRVYEADRVRALLDYPGCIDAVRRAMAAFSASETEQPLRQIVELSEGRLFGLMPGSQPDAPGFGAKVISVFGDPARPGRAEHRGVVVLFDGVSGAVACIADAAAVTEIRTAAASAVATDALARADARTLAIFGCGAQAESHIRALAVVRRFDAIMVWGRDPVRAAAFAERLAGETGLPIRPEPNPKIAAKADVICTVTGAREPILLGEWVRPGTHINLVGSSHPGPVEVDHALVVASRYIADSRRSVLAAGSEFLDAKAAELIGDDHIAAEIGEVLLGRIAGRISPDQITLYKSLGHVVQDLAAAAYIDAANARMR
ncbi:ornithine cyclodeaminase family protein [Sphingomonas sp. MMS24-J13]|uniref:ornithine cyclodeaminase family protein n=1 Tax=Sphingomonas sp. MMS24-J13 TaxID=3238686 RepID=UPI00384F5404